MYYGQTRPMEVYERQIKYLDFCENGQRSKGAGFIKVERQDNLCSISLQISGLYRKDRLVRPLLLLTKSGEQELCRMELADGGIKLYLDKLDCKNLDGRGTTYEQWTGIRVPISENKEICCRWGERKNTEIVMQKKIEKPTEPAEPEFVPVTDAFIPLQELVPRVDVEPLQEDLFSKDYLLEETPIREAPLEVENKEETVDDTAVIMDTKWEQLWAIYPHKKPFSDDREYLSMGPSDFVILGERHFKLANNSFLLHGYYNYRHLILTRIRERSQVRYYIGVPGIFLEREKKTAVMFGFQSFESAIEPAEDGDFGYYMIPVEL